MVVNGSSTLNDTLNVSGYVGIGTTTPSVAMDVNYTDAIRIPRGTTTERPTVTDEDTNGGYIRYNMTTHQFEGYGPGNAWGSLGGVINVAQNTKILASYPDADSTNNELVFYTADAGSTVSGDAVERMVIKSTGDVSMNFGLSVNGATTMASTLGVAGISTFQSKVIAEADLSANTTASIGGATVLRDTLRVDGGSTMNSTLDVTGATTMASTLSVTDAATLSSTLGVAGVSTFQSKVIAEADLSANGNVIINGDVSLNSNLYVANDLTIEGNLSVKQYSNESIINTTTTDYTLIVAEDLSLNGKLLVSDEATLQNSLSVTGATTMASTLEVTDAATLSNTLGVAGVSTFQSKIVANADLSANTTASIGGATVLHDTLTVNGASTLNSSLEVTSDSSFNNSLYIGGNLSVDGEFTVSGGIVFNGDLSLNGALFSNDISVNNISIGRGTGNVETNTVVGYNSMQYNSTGSKNAAFGYESLSQNTTGINNTAVGQSALYDNQTGGYNTGVGFESLKLTKANYNTAVGFQALSQNTTGTNNTAIGNQSGYNNKAGSYNTYIGDLADDNDGDNDYNYSTAIGYNAKISDSNQIMIGGDAVTGKIFLNASDISGNTESLAVGMIRFENESIPASAIVGSSAETTALTGDVVMEKTLEVSETTILKDKVFITGDLDVNSDIHVAGRMDIDGDVSFNSNVQMAGINNMVSFVTTGEQEIAGSIEPATTLDDANYTSYTSYSATNMVSQFNALRVSSTGQYVAIYNNNTPTVLSISNDYGSSYASVSLGSDMSSTNYNINNRFAMSSNGRYMLLVNNSNILVSHDYGVTFTTTTNTGKTYTCVAISSGQYMAIGTDSEKLYVSTDFGANFVAHNQSPVSTEGSGAGYEHTWKSISISGDGKVLICITDSEIYTYVSDTTGYNTNTAFTNSSTTSTLTSSEISSDIQELYLTQDGAFLFISIAGTVYRVSKSDISNNSWKSTTVISTTTASYAITTTTNVGMDGKFLYLVNKNASGHILVSNDYGATTPTVDSNSDVARIYNDIAVSGNGAYTYATSTTDIYRKNYNDGTTISVITGDAFIVSNDVSLNNRLFVSGDVSFNEDLYVEGITTLNNNLYVTGDASLNGKLYVSDYVGIGTETPSVAVDINYTDAMRIPHGTTTERPNVTDEATNGGYMRYNMTTHQFEGYGPGDSWGSLGGVINVAQNTKILASHPNADSTNNELLFYTASAGSTVSGDAIERMVIKSTGDVSMNHGLYVNGATVLNNSLTLTGTFDANSTADIADTLTLSKADGTGLEVTADASVGGALGVTGITTLTGALDANSTADIADTLTLSKAVGTGLDVTADASVGGALGVTGDATMSSALNVTGITTLTGALDANSSADIAGTLTLSKAAGTGLDVTADATVGGTLSVTGTSTLTGDVTMTNNLTVNSDVTIEGDLVVQSYTNENIINTTTTDYTLIVTEDLSLNGGLNASGTITGASLTDGTATISSGNMNTTGTIGSGAITSTAAVTGASLTDGTATISSGNMNTTGTINSGDITSSGTVTSNGIEVSGAILPSAALTYDIGSEQYPFRDLYFSTGSINFVGADGNKTALSISGGSIQTSTVDSQGTSVSDATPLNVVSNHVAINKSEASSGAHLDVSGNVHISENITVSGTVNVPDASITQRSLENAYLMNNSYTLTVADKTSSHIYTGAGSTSAYYIDGIESPHLTLRVGYTYTFDMTDSTNSSHPLLFYSDAAKNTAYTTGVTTTGTAGSSGATVSIVVSSSTPTRLYYQCGNHGYMGTWFNIDTAVDNVTTEEISFLTGVTSNIQDQLNASGIDTTQDVSFTSNTPATSNTTAALVVTGGIGLGGFIKQF